MSDAETVTADVVIIGAGPVGLSLANLLGVYGVSTLVVERNASTVAEPRAVSLDDESLRTMQAAGLADPVLRDLVLGYGVQYYSWRGKQFASVLPTRQEYGYPKRNAFRQPLLEATLREGLARFPHVRVLFQHEMQSFQSHDSGVRGLLTGPQGELRFEGAWMIGCDGGRSRVREQCGIRLQGATYAERWLIVDLAERTTPLRHTQTYCDPDRPAIRLPGPHGTLRYEFMLRPGEDDAFALDEPRFRNWMMQRCPADRDLQLVRKVVYTFHARVAERWQQGRVLLAGDAAHLTPPFAGQGMNSGVRDATNLAWKLAAVQRWGAPAALLDTYEPEREPHASALIRMALRIGHFMQPKTRVGAALSQGALRLACLLPPVRDYILQLRFKPKPRLINGYVQAERTGEGAGDGAELLPQPLMDLADRSATRLDNLLGDGFAVVGWDSSELRAHARALAPAGAPVRVVALARMHEDFIAAAAANDPVVCARDGSGVLDAFLDALGASALVVRPDRYWCRIVRADGWAAALRSDPWRLGLLATAANDIAPTVDHEVPVSA